MWTESSYEEPALPRFLPPRAGLQLLPFISEKKAEDSLR